LVIFVKVFFAIIPVGNPIFGKSAFESVGFPPMLDMICLAYSGGACFFKMVLKLLLVLR
jgi:hypothetical protein